MSVLCWPTIIRELTRHYHNARHRKASLRKVHDIKRSHLLSGVAVCGCGGVVLTGRKGRRLRIKNLRRRAIGAFLEVDCFNCAAFADFHTVAESKPDLNARAGRRLLLFAVNCEVNIKEARLRDFLLAECFRRLLSVLVAGFACELFCRQNSPRRNPRILSECDGCGVVFTFCGYNDGFQRACLRKNRKAPGLERRSGVSLPGASCCRGSRSYSRSGHCISGCSSSHNGRRAHRSRRLQRFRRAVFCHMKNLDCLVLGQRCAVSVFNAHCDRSLRLDLFAVFDNRNVIKFQVIEYAGDFVFRDLFVGIVCFVVFSDHGDRKFRAFRDFGVFCIVCLDTKRVVLKGQSAVRGCFGLVICRTLCGGNIFCICRLS